jgi:hypothetical protein
VLLLVAVLLDVAGIVLEETKAKPWAVVEAASMRTATAEHVAEENLAMI